MTKAPASEYEDGRRARWAVRVSMLVRCLTGLFGGYSVAAVVVSLAARMLPIEKVEATGWAMLTSFLLYGALGLWCFHEPRLGRVVTAVWGTSLIGALVLCSLGTRP